MKEEKITDQSKLKKRNQGRQLKIMGDLTLMINDPQDAIDYYKQALENLNKNNDYQWCGIIQQHLAASKSSFEDIEENFRESFKYLKRLILSIQRLNASNDKLGLNKTIDLFTKTFDHESSIEKCKFYLFISELQGLIQMKRKQAILYVQQVSSGLQSIIYGFRTYQIVNYYVWSQFLLLC